jgi:hypothetical protein
MGTGTDVPESGQRRRFPERLTTWLGIAGSLVTVLLTIWNAYIKAQIDRREEDLRVLEMGLKQRATGIEESKERVERYKWVLGLFPDLSAAEERKRNFTVSLIRLALTKDEAEQLFTSLQTSRDTALRSVGQSAIAAIETEPIAALVSQMNGPTPEVRKSAVASLERRYRSSSQAIALVLRGLEADRIDELSASGVINGLYYLSQTDPMAWEPTQAVAARQLVPRIEGRRPGPQTQAALNEFRALVAKLPAGS